MAKYMVCYGKDHDAKVFETNSFEEAAKQYAMCCLRKDSAVFTDLEKKKIVAQCLITIHGASVNINPGA